ncbi:MAG: hypothetical protein JO026_03730 [Patescibacteria group bacterium]|nr:hypothetical protein [Patescibacteria group bacterium]
MPLFDQIAVKIIKEQALVIGPLAWSEAQKVAGLSVVDAKKGEISITETDPKEVVNRLVAQYERLFGRASHEVCKDAVKGLIAELSVSEIPTSLLT